MKKINIGEKYAFSEYWEIILYNRKEIGDLPIHENFYNRYVYVLTFFPFSEKKEKIFKSLDRKAKMGMLNRHILSVAREVGISQIIIKKAKEETTDYKRCNENFRKYKDDFWKEYVEQHRSKIEEYYTLILGMIEEEIRKRSNVKYMRKKKLDKILNDN